MIIFWRAVVISFTLWQKVYTNYPDQFLFGYVDMFRWSSALHGIVYRFATTAKGGKHPLEWNTTAQYRTVVFPPSKIVILFNNHRKNGSRPSSRFTLVSDEEISKIDTSKTAPSKNIALAAKPWMATCAECCRARNLNVLNCQWKTKIISHR